MKAILATEVVKEPTEALDLVEEEHHAIISNLTIKSNGS